MGLESPSNQELLSNSIGFYVAAAFFLIVRLTNNAWVLQEFRWDDALMVFAFFTYTAMLALINASAHFATNLFPDDQLASILADPTDGRNRIIGSILVIPLEQCMLITIWSVKFCILGFIYRLTTILILPKTRLVVRCIAIYAICGFCVIEICYYAVLCRPFSQYWAVPTNNSQCATYSTYSKIQMAFNISFDIMIILVPTSIIYRSMLPLKRKIALIGLFSLGAFTILAAILNKYYNFASPETTVYALWYIREASVAIWVGNLICCWQLLQKLFNLRSFDNTEASFQVPSRSVFKERSIGGHIKITSWFNHKITAMKLLPVQRAVVADLEGALNDTSASPDGVTLIDSQTDTRTLLTIERGEEDAGPALAYRVAHGIE